MNFSWQCNQIKRLWFLVFLSLVAGKFFFIRYGHCHHRFSIFVRCCWFFFLFHFSCVFFVILFPKIFRMHWSYIFRLLCVCVCMPFKKQHSSNYFERKEMTIESIMSRHWRLQKTSIVVFNVLKKIPSMDLRNGQKSSCNIWLRHSICRELVSEGSVCVFYFSLVRAQCSSFYFE